MHTHRARLRSTTPATSPPAPQRTPVRGALAKWALARWAALCRLVRSRWRGLCREPDAGYSTETVLVTALLVIAALAVIGILVAKITAKANGITL